MDMVICKKRIKFMKDGLKMGSIVELENWYCQTKMYMLVNFLMAYFKEKVNMFGLMAIYIKVFIRQERDMVWESIKVKMNSILF